MLPNSHSSPSNAVLESAMNNSGLPRPLLVTLLLLTGLYILAPRIFNWFYPCQSVDTLQESISDIQKLIMDNNSAKRYILKDTAAGFRKRLKAYEVRVNNLKRRIRNEPARIRVFVWVAFKWKSVRELNDCYNGLRVLEEEVQAKVDSLRSAPVLNE